MNDGNAHVLLDQARDGIGACGEQSRSVQCVSADLYDETLHSNRSDSENPKARFMFCTACPAAPLSRLSRQLMTVTRLPSGASANPMSQKFVCAAKEIAGSCVPRTRTIGLAA